VGRSQPVAADRARRRRHERMSDSRPGLFSSVCSAPPAQVGDHGPVVGGVYACDRLAGQQDPLDQHVLVFASGTEEDVVDALVDQLRSGLCPGWGAGQVGRRTGRGGCGFAG
jgi:hypothetical protein